MGAEVTVVFLDIPKVLTVWHKGLIYELKQNGISGDQFSVFLLRELY